MLEIFEMKKNEEQIYENTMQLVIDSRSDNERLARTVVAAFAATLDPTLEEIADIKTAVSEAVTNAVIHGYENGPGKIVINCGIHSQTLTVCVEDFGVGIEDITHAMEAMYTSKPELERSGMGFIFMETFMDSLDVISEKGEGTLVRMTKKIGMN